MSVTVLVIDDEPQIRRAVRNGLARQVDTVLEAGTAQEGIDLAATARPAVIILDLGLPDADGVRVCREIRSWSQVPILVLSARHGEHDKVTLLDAGADDFMTKPFSTVELQARVRAMLRRVRRMEDETGTTRIGQLEIDVPHRTVRREGQYVHLTPTEWELLLAFVAQPDRTLTHQHLFNAVWPRSGGDAQQYLRVYVASLRRKLEVDAVRPRIIVTEPGVGYRFQTE